MADPDDLKPTTEIGAGRTILELEDRHTSGAYPKRPLAIVRGEGSYVWDEGDRRYLDLTGGQGVALLGHSHPEVVDAVRRQAQRLITCPEIFYNDQRANLMAELARLTPGSLNRLFLCNSGAEAVEAALKLARLITGRQEILAAAGGFHGRTMGALSATGVPKYRQPFEPLVPQISHFAYNDFEAAEEKITTQTAAVLLEVVQGEGGVMPAQAAFLQRVRELCHARGALLILDEIQTGLGRTGRWFACQHFGITPDVICLGKGIAGGLPMGAVVWDEALGTLPHGSHGSTFGGNPLACAAARATLAALEEEDLIPRSAERGRWLLEEIRKEAHPLVREVRGFGLMIGIELRVRVTPLLKELMEGGVLALPAGRTVLRLLPPLNIKRSQLEAARDSILSGLDHIQHE